MNNSSNWTKRMERYAITEGRNCCLTVITFENFEWISYRTRMVDISMTGIGVESDSPLEPGIIWFTECIYGLKFGKLVWCKQQHDGKYRAGIRLIRLSEQDEEHLQEDRRQFQSDRLPRHSAVQIEALISRYALY